MFIDGPSSLVSSAHLILKNIREVVFKMSKTFAGFTLVLSLFMLLLALTSSKPANIMFVLLWLLIGVASVYKLTKKSTAT